MNENFPNGIQNLPKSAHNFPKYQNTLKNAQDFENFANVAIFSQIWSHCSRHFYCYDHPTSKFSTNDPTGRTTNDLIDSKVLAIFSFILKLLQFNLIRVLICPFSFFLMGHSRPLFFISVIPIEFLIELIQIKFVNDWIRTADLWRWKRPLYQLRRNHCPFSICYTFYLTGKGDHLASLFKLIKGIIIY